MTLEASSTVHGDEKRYKQKNKKTKRGYANGGPAEKHKKEKKNNAKISPTPYPLTHTCAGGARIHIFTGSCPWRVQTPSFPRRRDTSRSFRTTRRCSRGENGAHIPVASWGYRVCTPRNTSGSSPRLPKTPSSPTIPQGRSVRTRTLTRMLTRTLTRTQNAARFSSVLVHK